MRLESLSSRRLILTACAVAMAIYAAGARAQSAWPSKPVKIVVPFAVCLKRKGQCGLSRN